MEFNEQEEKQLRKIIVAAVKANGNIFDKQLKQKLTRIIEQKFEGIENRELITTVASNIKNLEKKFNIEDENVTENKELIGGFIVKSQSKIIDASLSGYINNLAHKLAE